MPEDAKPARWGKQPFKTFTWWQKLIAIVVYFVAAFGATLALAALFGMLWRIAWLFWTGTGSCS